jgi:hypothetical protein
MGWYRNLLDGLWLALSMLGSAWLATLPMHIPVFVPAAPPDPYPLIFTVFAGSLVGGLGWKLHRYVGCHQLRGFSLPRRYRLRTLLIVMALGPILIWCCWLTYESYAHFPTPIESSSTVGLSWNR